MKVIKASLWTCGILLLAILLMGGAFRWGLLGGFTTKTPASQDALAALSSSDTVNVKAQQWLVFTPKAIIPKTGFIFYPCALCDPRGFAPLLHRIAEAGFLTVIVPMPSNFAIFDSDRALEVKTRYPDIDYWVIGGHSMGGGASAMFLYDHPNAVDGLMMWDSYTNESYDISSLKLPVLSIHGNHHHSPDRPVVFNNAKQFLPTSTEYQVVEGGDHFQFGAFNLSAEPERMTATISRSQQHQQIIDHSVKFLRTIAQGPKGRE